MTSLHSAPTLPVGFGITLGKSETACLNKALTPLTTAEAETVGVSAFLFADKLVLTTQTVAR